METYYKISKAQAEAIGRFEYETGKAFDPFVSEQKDGTFLISAKMYQVLKSHPKFKSLDLSKAQPLEKSALNTKTAAPR